MSPRKGEGGATTETVLSPEMERLVSELDARWRARNANQVQAINRLLMDSSYDHEMGVLHEQLARLQGLAGRAEELLRGSGLPGVSPAVGEALKVLAHMRNVR